MVSYHSREVKKTMIKQILVFAFCILVLGLAAPSGWAETGGPAKRKDHV